MVEEKKTTFMRIEVDLQCHRCRKKIKKVLCKIPQIQDQAYFEKENYVVIKVVCCSPEKVKQKIICKGGDTIKSIEIIEIERNTNPPGKGKKPKRVRFDDELERPLEKEKPPQEQKPPEKQKPPEMVKKPPQKKDPEPVSRLPLVPVGVPVPPGGFGTCCTECYEGRGGGPCLYGHGTRPWPPLTPKPRAEPVPLLVPIPVPAYPVRFGTCCTECYEGRDGGPCHYGHGRPPPCYDGYYYGRPIYDSYGGGYRSCYTYVSRCEETSSGCTIM
ncbi:protein PYRICULARIA ORYZAE RESISTANCE 21-like isoform X1 [Quercus robur]|uniref:protein PYRICULARIA ORYZAE RESISTANCE 21-like isoform X1 n=2 Tax=Quercus robur TaxID=38942 RepID=UPI0021613228|nr:protein PYRICULARIA ORYZAE RESISTANCE 21-like isoform X1 [Quercus robur]